MRFWVRGYASTGRNRGRGGIPPGRSQCGRGGQVRARRCCRRFNRSCPARCCSSTAYDRSQTIVNSINDVQDDAVHRVRPGGHGHLRVPRPGTDTLIPAVALPLSLLLTFIVMNLLGYSLDNLSLMALTLAIGFLVDDAIVFLENTVRRMERSAMRRIRGVAAIGQGDQLHDSRHDALAGGGVHPAGVHERPDGAHLPRVLRHHRRLDSGQRHRLADAYAADVPRACSAIAAQDAKKTWMERVFGAIEHRVLDVYGRSLWFFLRHRWISAVIWVVCLVGTVYLF